MVHNKRTFFLKVCLFVKEQVYNNKTFVHIKHTRYSRDQISCSQ